MRTLCTGNPRQKQSAPAKAVSTDRAVLIRLQVGLPA